MNRQKTDRVFLDANVLFSAAYAPATRMRRFWQLPSHRARLLTSDYAVDEAMRNLADDRQPELDALLRQVDIVASPPMSAWIDLPDAPTAAKDLPILQAAIVSGASHLATGDRRHFGELYSRVIVGVLIIVPADYLAQFPPN